MLTAKGCRERRERLWDRLDEKPDWIVISAPQHLVYFANFYLSPFVFRSSNAGGVLILGKDGSSTLICDNVVSSQADETCVDEVVAPVWYRSVESAPDRAAFLVDNVLSRLESFPGNHFGIESTAVAAGVVDGVRMRRDARVTPVEQVIHQLKRAKDADELAVLKISMTAGEAGHAAALSQIKPGMTELQAYQVVQNAAMESVGAPVVVYGDFVSGPRCEAGGGPPSQRVIESGDLVILDYSVVVNGYRGDFTNTFACGGEPSDEHRKMFDACLAAMHAGEQELRAGTPCKEVDAAARKVFEQHGYLDYFRHHTGHGLGLGHPDPPYLVPESTDQLIANDVVTIEPGVYIEGVGGMRFERNYRITDDGFENLSHHRLTLEAD